MYIHTFFNLNIFWSVRSLLRFFLFVRIFCFSWTIFTPSSTDVSLATMLHLSLPILQHTQEESCLLNEIDECLNVCLHFVTPLLTLSQVSHQWQCRRTLCYSTDNAILQLTERHRMFDQEILLNINRILR